MIRGYYTAASGLVTQEKKLNNVANNLANASTVGYKRENIVMGTFGEHLSIRRNAYQNAGYAGIGPSVYMQVVDGKYTDHAQGGFEETTRPLDMSIMGDGYFVIATPEGEELLSRDGQFSLDEEGYLILPGFGRVQGEGGDIQAGVSQIAVDQFGNIAVEDEEGEFQQIDRLLVAIPDDPATLEKYDNSLFIADGFSDAEGEARGAVRQYWLERSNVNMSDEMTKLLESQRALQSCSQIVKMYDEMAEQIATRISRV